MKPEIDNLLTALLDDFSQPDFWWEAGMLLLCLGIGKVAERFVRDHQLSDTQNAVSAWRLGQGGLKRITFPLVALLLVAVARLLLQGSHPVGLLTLAIPLLLSLAVIRSVFYVVRYSLSPSDWLAKFERSFALLVWTLVALHIVGWLPQLVDLLEAVSFPVGRQRLNLWLIAQGLVTVVVTMLIALWVSGLIDTKLAQAPGLDGNLRTVFSRFSKAVLLMLAVMIGLPLVGIDLTTLSVFGGALGVGLGLGLQKIASNYVAGFIILLDRSIRIGNVISVAGERGQVSRITARYTVLQSVTGVEAIVPNEVLVASVVLNESYTDPRVRFNQRIQIGYASDVEQAQRLMLDVATAQPRVLAEPAPEANIVEFADNGIVLELGFWITNSQHGMMPLRSEINLAMWKAFRQAGIEIPHPQREVHLVGKTPVHVA